MTVCIEWRDRQGKTHMQELKLDQGAHEFVLGDTAEEK